MRISPDAGAHSPVTTAPEAPAAWTTGVDSEEARLIEAAIEGNTLAFAALYQRHVARVLRDCYYRTGNQNDAEDLTQQTFLQAWKAIRRYQPGRAAFIAWLLRISHNLVVSHYRKAKERATDGIEGFPELVAGQSTDPESIAISDLAHDALRRAVLKLKPERQQVIILRFIEGFSVAEVADVLGKRKDYIYTLQRRALFDLRRLLEAQEESDESWSGGKFQATILSAARRITSRYVVSKPSTPELGSTTSASTS
ncbi:MAG: RNA polymerase sigma factor, partial [Chloroflexi bacterium]|nr:RNA polymerase sigma factor [Chloroflexota bacterium]